MNFLQDNFNWYLYAKYFHIFYFVSMVKIINVYSINSYKVTSNKLFYFGNSYIIFEKTIFLMYYFNTLLSETVY